MFRIRNMKAFNAKGQPKQRAALKKALSPKKPGLTVPASKPLIRTAIMVK